jgi:hypothetical protein
LYALSAYHNVKYLSNLVWQLTCFPVPNADHFVILKRVATDAASDKAWAKSMFL